MKSETVVLAALLGLAAACRLDMHDQPRYEPLEPSVFFDDGRSARPLVEGTVARGQVADDAVLYTGTVDGEPAEGFPYPITREILLRGSQEYQIFCRPCHGGLGYGDGIIVERGFPAPPSFHDPAYLDMPPGHIFQVVTNGFGMMMSYAYRVPPDDRWAIAAYIETLQLSQNAALDDVPEDVRSELLEER